MALQVQGTFELENGIQLNSTYARTEASLRPEGNAVDAYPFFWVDEAAFTSRKDSLSIQLEGAFTYGYDRATDGVDILDFANKKVKETLESLGYTVTIIEL